MDGKVDGFDRGGAGLFIDEAQMAKYLETADLVLGQRCVRPQAQDPPRANRCLAKRPLGARRSIKGEFVDADSYPGDHPLRNKEQVKVPMGANWVRVRQDGGMEFVGTGYHGDGSIDFHGGTWHSWGGPVDARQNSPTAGIA